MAGEGEGLSEKETLWVKEVRRVAGSPGRGPACAKALSRGVERVGCAGNGGRGGAVRAAEIRSARGLARQAQRKVLVLPFWLPMETAGGEAGAITAPGRDGGAQVRGADEQG